MIRVLLAILLTSSLAWPATKSCPSGTLTPTPITANTTPSADWLLATAKPAIVFQAVNTAGTATVEIDMCCVGSCDIATGTWSQVSGSPMTLTVSSAVVGVANPTCIYRAYTTACSTCSVTVGYSCSGP